MVTSKAYILGSAYAKLTAAVDRYTYLDGRIERAANETSARATEATPGFIGVQTGVSDTNEWNGQI